MAAALPFIMMGVSALGAMTSAQASQQAGEAEKKAADAEARQVEFSTVTEAEESRKRNLRTIAAQRAGYGYAGLSMEGSPLLVQMESLAESEKEYSNILQTGRMKAKALRTYGEESESAGQLGAMGELFGGAGDIFTQGKSLNWWS